MNKHEIIEVWDSNELKLSEDGNSIVVTPRKEKRLIGWSCSCGKIFHCTEYTKEEALNHYLNKKQ
jgi:hypothetical protein